VSAISLSRVCGSSACHKHQRSHMPLTAAPAAAAEVLSLRGIKGERQPRTGLSVSYAGSRQYQPTVCYRLSVDSVIVKRTSDRAAVMTDMASPTADTSLPGILFIFSIYWFTSRQVETNHLFSQAYLFGCPVLYL